jgi:hypothetical protein
MLPGKSLKSVKLREVRFDDYPQIAALVSKFHLQIESYSGWVHLWSNNPAFRQVRDKFPMGWVLADDEGAISGYLGNIPLNYELEGKRLLVATTRAWVVDSPHRSYSMLLLGTYFQQACVDLFLSTTVNEQSTPAYTNFGTIRVPVGRWDRTLFWIAHYPGFTRSFLRKRGVAMASALSYPVSSGVFVYDRLTGSRPPKQTNAPTARGLEAFDERFDVFWEALRKIKRNVLLAVRNREALEWHFKAALAQSAAWIYVIESNSGLAAYSVFLRDDYPEIGLTRMRLVDFQCLEQDRAADLLVSMLRAAMHRCRRESVHMLELVGLAPELESKLQSAAPHTRSLPNWLYFYKANTPALAETLKTPGVWQPSLFDGDSSLWSEAISLST